MRQSATVPIVRVVCSIVLAACVAFVAARAPHLRRAHPDATLSAPTAHHFHHARSHRSPATVATRVLLPSRELALVDPLNAEPDRAIDREPITLVARGPPSA
jgi:hypothetical protein